jgi:hypothetical protein
VFGFTIAFWQYFEFAFTLNKNGLIESPVCSGTLGYRNLTTVTLASRAL